MPDAQRQSLITVMFITCRRPRRLRSRMSPALLDPGGCPSVLGSYRRACSSIRSGIGGSAPRARLLHALAWPRVTGRLSSEVRPGVRVSGSRVRHVTTRDTSHGPSRRHVGRWVMLKLMRVRGRGTPCGHQRTEMPECAKEQKISLRGGTHLSASLPGSLAASDALGLARSGFEATPVVDADHGKSESHRRRRRGRCCGGGKVQEGAGHPAGALRAADGASTRCRGAR
jgi:hypothetical protein